jgi:hypothetical protein
MNQISLRPVFALLAVAACGGETNGGGAAGMSGGGGSGSQEMTSGAGGGSAGEQLPDLVLDADYLIDTTTLDTVTVEDVCQLQEGCVTGLGERKVVRFGSRTGNVGNADFVLGVAREDNPLWTRNTCRDSFDLVGFARYALLDRSTNEEVVVGAKSGFCIADADHYVDDFGFCNVYDCEHQGIGQGCADNYGSELECQWIDITDVKPGAYELRVTINADRSVPELGYDNNVVRVQLDIGENELQVVR